MKMNLFSSCYGWMCRHWWEDRPFSGESLITVMQQKTFGYKQKYNKILNIEAAASSHVNTEHQLAWRILCYVENWQIYVSTDVCSSQIYEFAALHAGCENVHHCHSPAVDPHSRFPHEQWARVPLFIYHINTSSAPFFNWAYLAKQHK